METSTKRCSGCGQIKALEEFNKRTASADGHQPQCRECVRSWHVANGTSRRAAIARRRDRVRADNRSRLISYLAEHPCVDCGEDDPVVLEFDHRDRGSKRRSVSFLLQGAYSWDTVADEIAKCDVRCCNCHRLRTIAQMGWWLAAGDLAPRPEELQ